MFRIRKWLKEQIKEWQSGVGRLEAKSEVFRSLFPQNVKIERVATGLRFSEGPVWFAEEKYLLFSDIPANRILKLTPDRQVTTFRQPSGNSTKLEAI